MVTANLTPKLSSGQIDDEIHLFTRIVSIFMLVDRCPYYIVNLTTPHI
jgi:hypothetical protein